MKKTKFLITAFAVFGALLMLMTTCIARPVQEKTSIEVFEYAEKELINSFEALNVKLSRDVQASALIDAIARDLVVTRSVSRIEQARSEEEVLFGIEQLVGVLQDSSEFEQLVNIVEEDYSAEAEAISTELASMGYDTFGLGGLIDIIATIIQIIILLVQIILTVIGLIDLIKTLLGLLGDLWDWINGGGDDGGTPAY